MSQEIANIFKAYDIRGLVDDEITPDFTFATGVAFAHFLQQQREPGTVVIGEDMRPSSIPLADAFSAGVTSLGMDVIRIGLASYTANFSSGVTATTATSGGYKTTTITAAGVADTVTFS